LVDPNFAPFSDIVSKLREGLGIFEHATLDEVGHRVEFDGGGVASQPGRFKRDRAATGE
jgi:hypothetical protein